MKNRIIQVLKVSDYGLLISIVLFLSVVLPIIVASGYSVLSTDDFFTISDVLDAGGNNVITKSFNATYGTYFSWSGAYSGAFAEFFLGYFVSMHWGFVRVFLVISNLIILVVVFFFIRESMHFFGVYQNRTSTIIFLWTIISWWTIRFYQEVFYWMIGNIAYNLSLIFCLLSMIVILRAERKRQFFVLSIVLELIATGFAIQTGALLCFFILCLLVNNLSKKKDIKWFALAFCISVFGELLRVLAPGNFARHRMADSTGDLHVTGSVIHSVNSLIEYISNVVKNPIVIIALIVMFYVGFKELKEKVDCKSLSIIILYTFVAMILQIFPVLLGYSGTGLSSFANRTYYPLDFVTILGLMLSSFLSGSAVRGYLGLKADESVIKLIVVILVISVLFPNMYTVYLNTSRHTYNSLAYGEIQGYSRQIYTMFYDIQNSTEENVEIEALPVCPATFHAFDLSNNPAQSINKRIAKFFDKDSIWVKPI